MKKVFKGKKDWEAVNAAEDWCAKRGISVGTMQSTSPRGLKCGDYDIAKWRNLDPEDIAGLDGTMQGDMRHGPVVIELNDEVAEGL